MQHLSAFVGSTVGLPNLVWATVYEQLPPEDKKIFVCVCKVFGRIAKAVESSRQDAHIRKRGLRGWLLSLKPINFGKFTRAQPISVLSGYKSTASITKKRRIGVKMNGAILTRGFRGSLSSVKIVEVDEIYKALEVTSALGTKKILADTPTRQKIAGRKFKVRPSMKPRKLFS